MEEKNNSQAFNFIKVFSGFFFYIVLFTYDVNDPSPFNLSSPTQGIYNYFGVIGALISGFLLEQFGYLAFLIPTFLIFFGLSKTQGVWLTKIFKFSLFLFALSGLLALPNYLAPSLMFKAGGLWGSSLIHLLSSYNANIFGAIVLILFVIQFGMNIRVNQLSILLILSSLSSFKFLLKSFFLRLKVPKINLQAYLRKLNIDLNFIKKAPLLDLKLPSFLDMKSLKRKYFGFTPKVELKQKEVQRKEKNEDLKDLLDLKSSLKKKDEMKNKLLKNALSEMNRENSGPSAKDIFEDLLQSEEKKF